MFDAVEHKWISQIDTIATLIKTQFFVAEGDLSIAQPRCENFPRGTVDSKLHYLENMIRAIIRDIDEPCNAAWIIIESLLYIVDSTIVQEDTGGRAADTLRLFSELFIEAETSTHYGFNHNCLYKARDTFRFAAEQPYKLGFVEKSDWWRNFAGWYLIHECIRPLGVYFFSHELGPAIVTLSDALPLIVENVILGEFGKPATECRIGNASFVVEMFKEWFEAAPLVIKRKPWRNNGDLIVTAILKSIDRIGKENKNASGIFLEAVKINFEKTYVWNEILKEMRQG